MSDLLKALSAQGNTTSHVRVVDAPEEKGETFPSITSIEAWMDWYEKELRADHAPVRLLDEAEYKRHMGRGWAIPEGGWGGWDPASDPGHCSRWYMEERAPVPIEHVVNLIREIQHRNNIHVSVSAKSPGSFHNALVANRHTQAGRWRPALVEFEQVKRPFLDRVVPSRQGMPGKAENFDLLDEAGKGPTNGWTTMANMMRECVIVRLLWVDTARQREPRVVDGVVIADQNITVKGADGGGNAALAEALGRMAEGQAAIATALAAKAAPPEVAPVVAAPVAEAPKAPTPRKTVVPDVDNKAK